MKAVSLCLTCEMAEFRQMPEKRTDQLHHREHGRTRRNLRLPRVLRGLSKSGRARRRSVLYVFVKPAKHLVNKLFVRLQGGIPVWLVRQHHQPSGAAVASNGFEELARLQERSARLHVFRPMQDEERYLDFVGVEKRGNFQVDIGCLP